MEVRANAEQVLHDESPNTEDLLEAVASGRSGAADFEEEWQASAWELRKVEARTDLQRAWCGQLFELHCRLVTFGANAGIFDNPFIFAALRDDEQDSLRSQNALLYCFADMFDGVRRDRGLGANAGS